MSQEGKSVRVFISHAYENRQFAQQLATDLKTHNQQVWLYEQELKPGDSIIDHISEALADTDYLVVVLSNASSRSRWVRAELNAALMNDLSEQGTVVLPVLLEDSPVPQLLRDRVYADFRFDYDAGLSSLLQVLDQEVSSADSLASRPEHKRMLPPTCVEALAALRLAELRRRMTHRLGRAEIAALWFDSLETRMDDDMVNRTKVECIIELLERARERKLLDYVIHNLCIGRPDLLND